MIRVADYIINEIYKNGAHHVFTVTGRGALFLTDALAAHKQIKTVCTHHEQAAALAAVAYSQCNETLGACLVSTGCAGTNTLTGVLNAWQDGVPVVFIYGQNKFKETSRYTGIKIRTYGQQEADLIPVVESITKYASMILDPEQTVYEVGKALYLAKSGRMGPVWLDVPLDVQNMRIDPSSQRVFVPEEISSFVRQPLSLEEADFIQQALRQAKRPVVLIGSGVRAAQAIIELKSFVEKYSIPLVYSVSAPDVFDVRHPLNAGSVGAMGCSRSGNFAVQNCDLLLVLGCRMSSMTTGEFCKFARGAKTIVVDIDPVEHSKCGMRIDRFIERDVKFFLSEVLSYDLKSITDSWVSKIQHWKEIFPRVEASFRHPEKVDLYELAEVLSKKMPEKTVFHSDSGLIELILPSNIEFGDSQRCIHPASQGCMGAALPSLVGSYFAHPDHTILAVIGDGSIMMNLQELETIRYNKIPAKIIVVNNYAYSIIRKRQVELFRGRTVGTDPDNGVSCPDFKKVAETFGLEYQRIESPKDLASGITKMFASAGAVLVEVMGLTNQSYIHSSYCKNENGKVVNRPIEDQSPFLSREVFLKEMIIDPIDQ